MKTFFEVSIIWILVKSGDSFRNPLPTVGGPSEVQGVGCSQVSYLSRELLKFFVIYYYILFIKPIVQVLPLIVSHCSFETAFKDKFL